MIAIAAAALFGALLGLCSRPASRAMLTAAVTVGAAQYAMIGAGALLLKRPGQEGLAWALQRYAGVDGRDLAPTVLSAVFAAGVCGLVQTVLEAGERKRRERRADAIERGGKSAVKPRGSRPT